MTLVQACIRGKRPATAGTPPVRHPRQHILRRFCDSLAAVKSGDGVPGPSSFFSHRERQSGANGDCIDRAPRLGRADGYSLAANFHEGRSRECRKQNDVGDLDAEFTAAVAGGEGTIVAAMLESGAIAPIRANDQNPKGSTRTFSGNFSGSICTPPILQSACQMNLPPIFWATLLASSGTNTVWISTSTKILVDGLPAQVPLCGSIAITTG
jgi:hypothetical protein